MTAETTYTPEQVFGADKIKEWTKEGHWPPPEGIMVLPELHPDPANVRQLLVMLRDLSAPEERKIFQEVIDIHDRNL
jgi:hypothetical protein